MDGKLAEAEAAGELRQPTWMPLVARHPRTGRKALLLAPYLVYKIRSTDGDLSPRASREFAQQLMERASSLPITVTGDTPASELAGCASRRCLAGCSVRSNSAVQATPGSLRLDVKYPVAPCRSRQSKVQLDTS